MSELVYATVWSVDSAAGTARVGLEGSEGTAVTARVSSGADIATLAAGTRCVVGVLRDGEYVVLASI